MPFRIFFAGPSEATGGAVRAAASAARVRLRRNLSRTFVWLPTRKVGDFFAQIKAILISADA